MATTVGTQREAITEAGRRAADELAQARERRSRLSLDVLAGKPAARKDLEALDVRIGELTREVELAGEAVIELDRREQEAAERRAATQRAADAAELERLTGEQAERFRAIQRLVGELAPEVEAAAALGDRIHDQRVRLDLPYVPDVTRGRIFNYLALKLGPMGAGLRDLPTPFPALRGPLVPEPDRA